MFPVCIFIKNCWYLNTFFNILIICKEFLTFDVPSLANPHPTSKKKKDVTKGKGLSKCKCLSSIYWPLRRCKWRREERRGGRQGTRSRLLKGPWRWPSPRDQASRWRRWRWCRRWWWFQWWWFHHAPDIDLPPEIRQVMMMLMMMIPMMMMMPPAKARKIEMGNIGTFLAAQ